MSDSMLAPLRLALRDTRNASPLLWTWALVFFAFSALTYLGTFIDARLLNGVSVWDKPAKFFLSVSLQMATLAWGLSLLADTERRAPAIRMASVTFIAIACFEVFYITLQGARGEASHFNNATVFTSTMFLLMGIGAVGLSVITIFIGGRILKYAPASPVSFGAGIGFILGGVFAVVSGVALSSHGSHWVGGIASDATGLPFFHWSRAGGDLRAPHFFGLHIMQALPLLGFLCRDCPLPRARVIIAAGAIAWTALAAVTFIQALQGRPLIG